MFVLFCLFSIFAEIHSSERQRSYPAPIFVETWIAEHIMKPMFSWYPKQGISSRIFGVFGLFFSQRFSIECIILLQVHNKMKSLNSLHA